MSSTYSGSESRELPRSDEEVDATENGFSHEENGNGTPASWPASKNPPTPLALAFPISRVRRIVKSGGDTQWVGVEAGFLITKATEVFLEKMVEETFDRMQENQQESILYPHLSSHVASSERLEFLADFVPSKISAPAAISNSQMMDKQ